MRLKGGVFFFLLISSIYSAEKSIGFDLYEPGIFNPLGPTLLYGNPDVQTRPYMLIALDRKGNIIEKSLLQYDKEGRLIEEKIFNVKNQPRGSIIYIYDDQGKIKEEQYKDINNQIIAKKKRYYRKDKLVKIDIFDKNELVFSRKYKYEKNQIIGREFQKGASDPFIIKLQNGLIQSVKFINKNKTLMEIKYIYQKGRLLKRWKTIVGNSREECKYNYDAKGRLKEYTYYRLIRNQWQKYKTIQFIYADQI